MIFIIHDYFNGTISKIIHFIYSDFRLTPVVILFFYYAICYPASVSKLHILLRSNNVLIRNI